jgi:hypothetical protein
LTEKESNSKFDKELLGCHDFLMPWMVIRNEKFFYLAKKSNFKEIKVGYIGNQIRFQYFMDTNIPEEWFGAQLESKPWLFFTFECDSDFKVVGTYDDEFFKGAELAEVKLTKTDEIDGFIMF